MSSVVFLIAIGALFYFMLVAPQRRKQRAQQQLTSNLVPGVEVMTTAGLFATVHAVTDDEVQLEVAPGIIQRYAKGAVLRVVTPPDDDEPHELEAGTDEPHELESGSDEDGDGPSDSPAAPREP